MKQWKYGIPGLFMAFLFLSGCAGGKVKTEPEQADIFYPALPNQPRYQYLTTFSDSRDVEKKKSRLFKFVAGSDQDKPKAIIKPYGIDLFEGVMYVCDIRSHALLVLDLGKKEFGYLGARGSGKLSRPINVRVDRGTRTLFVTDMGRGQILRFDLSGKLISVFGKKGELNPGGLDILDDKLFVSDVKSSEVLVLDKETGEERYRIGKAGHSEGELFHPVNLVIQNRKLYIADMTNFRISVFDIRGNFIRSYGKPGRKPGMFTRPKGIAVDREERIYVVDSSFENVQVFNKEFQLLLFFLRNGIERDNINLPAMIRIDYDHLDYFRQYISPDFKAEYLIFITSNFGRNKINVYAFGEYEKK